MSVNTFIVFDDEGNYRFFLSCSDSIAEVNKKKFSNIKQLSKEEYTQYMNTMNNGKIPKLDLETKEIIFIDDNIK